MTSSADGGGVLLHNLIVFGRLLRRAGLDVHTGRLQDLAEALQQINLAARDEVYHTCRTLLIHRREDIPTFDAVFAMFWRDHGADAEQMAGDAPRTSRDAATAPSAGLEVDADEAGANAPEPEEDDEQWRTWSDVSTLAHKDFSDFTPDEIAIAQTALDRLTWTPGMRRTRRWVAGRGARVDVRRAIARSLRTGGDVVVFPREKRRQRPRPLVLLCDVSGSMERFSRMLLHFAYAMTRQQGQIEVFLFSTRLTNITADLKTRGLDRALARVSQSVEDWSGGTRIGDALRELNKRWSRRVLVRGPVVLIISDGWDRGDPAVIRTEMSRLQRSCHHLIWLNPLIGTTDYAPLTRGLQAALPFVHDFMAVRTLTNLADLAVHLNALDRNR